VLLTLKAAWAPGTGVKESNFKANWDVDMGVTYVPWEELQSVNIDALAVGGMIDNDSLPEHMKSKSTHRQHAHTHTHMYTRTHKYNVSWCVFFSSLHVSMGYTYV